MHDIQQAIRQSIAAKEAVLGDADTLNQVSRIIDVCVKALSRDGKVLFCGNGGSAADAQHLAAELSGRFYRDRKPLFAEALHVNTSYLTAVANDYAYEDIYSRLVEAKGRRGDVLIGLSTSGNSANVVRALEQGRKQSVITVGLTGESGGGVREFSDLWIGVPSGDTPRIQECHMLLGHIICEQVEKRLFP